MIMQCKFMSVYACMYIYTYHMCKRMRLHVMYTYIYNVYHFPSSCSKAAALFADTEYVLNSFKKMKVNAKALEKYEELSKKRLDDVPQWCDKVMHSANFLRFVHNRYSLQRRPELQAQGEAVRFAWIRLDATYDTANKLRQRHCKTGCKCVVNVLN